MSDNDIPPFSGAEPAVGQTPSGVPSAVPTSWQEQDPVLRDMWLQNKAPQEISAVLGRSVAAIMTRAARLGLPRRAAPGRKPGSRRMAGEAERRVSLPRQTARIDPGTDRAPQISTRICLMCLRPFQSQGRHNRICPSCKNSSEYESAVSLADINFPV